MSAPPTLLAKSPRRKRVTLEEHSLDTERAAALLFTDGRFGDNFCRFFRVADRARFLIHVRLAALLHDLGKANRDFLAAVNRTGADPAPQMLRHEHLSALILHLPVLRGWLERSPLGLDLSIITAAVLSHHIKAAADGPHAWGVAGGSRLPVYLGHQEVLHILRRVADVAQLEPPAAQSDVDLRPNQPPFGAAWQQGKQAARELGRSKDPARRALLLATKAGVIAADAVSSALVRESRDFDDWVRDNAHGPRLTPEEIAHAILHPREEQIRRARGQFAYDDFQRHAAQQGPRCLLLAACGAGKSLAAWKWAEAQARAHAFGRVIFLYPTRGTATEGFRDYVGFAPEGEADLVTGTARYDLEAIAQNPDEPATAGKRIVADEAEERLFALRLWGKRYYSATVDQFLAFLEHSYRSLCLLPALADSALIIDEVHSFSPHMFKNLIAFLQAFDLPVLCMTATLSNARKEQLQAAGLTCFPGDQMRLELADLRQKDEHLRYRLVPLSGAAEALERAVAAYDAGQRVLWVVNQVARSQQLAQTLHERLGFLPLCYHSRYRLKDRAEIHRQTVAAFRKGSPPIVAVTTQVCEMSLDLDADVLITEHAPVSSLVQRFGRANRRLDRGLDFRATLHTYAPDSDKPYAPDELEAAAAFLRELGPAELSQRQLAEALERQPQREDRPDGSARFLESGYYAIPGSFRGDEENYTLTCLLDREEDLQEAQALIRARKPYDGLLVPVPRREAREADGQHTFLPKFLRLAPGDRYDARLGYLAQEARD